MKILYLTDQTYLHAGVEKVLSQKASCLPTVVGMSGSERYCNPISRWKNNDGNVHKGAPVSAFIKAQQMREHMTPAESIWWAALKGNQRMGLKFRRQHPVQLYIVDFYCHQLKLVIELDGGYHATEEQNKLDAERTEVLEETGLHVMLFTKDEVLNEMDTVLRKIKEWSAKQ